VLLEEGLEVGVEEDVVEVWVDDGCEEGIEWDDIGIDCECIGIELLKAGKLKENALL
jgi:hypothetical protein